jgi:hypothetical protein
MGVWLLLCDLHIPRLRVIRERQPRSVRAFKHALHDHRLDQEAIDVHAPQRFAPGIRDEERMLAC